MSWFGESITQLLLVSGLYHVNSDHMKLVLIDYCHCLQLFLSSNIVGIDKTRIEN